MAHLILTRFNSEPIDPIQRKKGKFLDEEWLKNRIRLADEYFKPSLDAQSCKDFTLVVALHPQSPNYVEKYFENFAEIIYGQITDRWISLGDTTTRLDSDDMIHKDFVKLVKKAKGPLPLLVDFHTAQYDAARGRFHRVNRNSNNSQFVSVKGSTAQRHCYCTSHTKMPKMFRNQVRIPVFGGVQVVHGDNIFTDIPKGPEINLKLSDYGKSNKTAS